MFHGRLRTLDALKTGKPRRVEDESHLLLPAPDAPETWLRKCAGSSRPLEDATGHGLGQLTYPVNHQPKLAAENLPYQDARPSAQPARPIPEDDLEIHRRYGETPVENHLALMSRAIRAYSKLLSQYNLPEEIDRDREGLAPHFEEKQLLP